MSWSLFKLNVLRKTSPTGNPSLSINQVATIWSDEYDAAIKRGKDFINLESIQKGNKELMKSLFLIALLKGLATPPGKNFSLVNEFGNGVKAYWIGAQMSPFPIPLIPAPGSIQNIVVNSNIAINPGTWPIYPPLKPAKKQEIMINMFILAAVIHLFSVSGIIQTTSLYPAVPSPIPSPGVIPWTGYLVPPVIPRPNRNFPSEDESEATSIEESDSDIVDELNENISTNSDGSASDGNGGDGSASDGNGGDGTLLQDVIDETIPDDVIDKELENILPDFIKQLEMGGTKCK